MCCVVWSRCRRRERAVLARRSREGYGGGGSLAVELQEMAVGDGEDDGGIGGITTVMMEERKKFELQNNHTQIEL